MIEGKQILELYPYSNLTKEMDSHTLYYKLLEEFEEAWHEFKQHGSIEDSLKELDDLIMVCNQLKYKLMEENNIDIEIGTHHYYMELIRKLEKRGTI